MRAPAGTLQGKMEKAARAKAGEMLVLTTTHAVATIGAGFAAGTPGSAAACMARCVVTVEEEARTLTLRGEEANPLLHTSVRSESAPTSPCALARATNGSRRCRRTECFCETPD